MGRNENNRRRRSNNNNSNNNNNNNKRRPKKSSRDFTVGEQLRREEWSEGAVSILLDAYQTKWAERNRGKLKANDWEDVAYRVSSRACSTKAPKTHIQCKNKIESIKKRYRLESAAGSSSWSLFPRLDRILRCNAPSSMPNCTDQPPLLPDGILHGLPKFNGGSGDKEAEERRKRGRGGCEVVESIKGIAKAVLRAEKAKMETMRELERVRAEAEAKMVEMDLKRTQIISNTQVEVTRLLLRKKGKVSKSIQQI